MSLPAGFATDFDGVDQNLRELDRLVREQVQPRSYAIVYATANQNITNNTFTDILFDSEQGDTLGFHDTAANTARLTPVRHGLYRVEATVTWGVSVAAGVRSLRIARWNSGGTFQQAVAAQEAASCTTAGTSQSQNASGLVQCNAGDYLTVQLWQNSGGTLATLGTLDKVRASITNEGNF